MCLAVYLASDHDIPAIEPDRHSANVSILVDNDPSLKNRFSLPQIYYVGSHSGCGCGYIKAGCLPSELQKSQQNYTRLAEILQEAAARGVRLELFACWEGDQVGDVDQTVEITLADLASPAFELQELFVYRIVG